MLIVENEIHFPQPLPVMRVLLLALLCASAVAQQQVATRDVARDASFEQSHKPLIAGVSTTGGLLGHMLLVCLIATNNGCIAWLFFVSGILGLAMFFGCFFGVMWDAYIRLRFWDYTTFTVSNVTTHSYVCFGVFCDHGCSEAPTRVPCSTMQAQMVAGSCTNGHQCCSQNSCELEVDNLWCTVVNGTCTTQDVTLTYSRDGTLWFTDIVVSCGTNDVGCAHQYTIGMQFDAWQNPTDPGDLARNVHYTNDTLAWFGISLVFIAVAYLLLFGFVFAHCFVFMRPTAPHSLPCVNACRKPRTPQSRLSFDIWA
jgi:hypothetical protein